MLRRAKTCIMVALLLTSFIVSAAEQVITARLERKAELELNTGTVDLGLPTGPERSQYCERLGAVTLSFRCNARTPWEVRLSGTDFTNDSNSIPITQLSWKKGSTHYSPMPSAGRFTVVADSRDYPEKGANWHDETISYLLALTGDEYEGTYNATLTYTLFVQ